jgi:hypothetical protein
MGWPILFACQSGVLGWWGCRIGHRRQLVRYPSRSVGMILSRWCPDRRGSVSGLVEKLEAL